MDISSERSAHPTWSRGLVNRGRLICQYSSSHVKSNGVFLGDNPLDFTTPTLLVQIACINFFSRIIYYVIRNIRQNLLAAQIITGLVLGPSLLTHDRRLADMIFPPAGTLVLRTFGCFGFMFHVFGLGVNMNVTMLKGTGKKATFIGLSALICSTIFGMVGLGMVEKRLPKEMSDAGDTKYEIPLFILINSVSSFLVTVTNLVDLNLINSDLGSLASSAAVISDGTGWFFIIGLGNVVVAGDRYKKTNALYAALNIGMYYWCMFFVLRPIVLVFIRKTPEGKQLRESHFFIILIFALLIGYTGEYIGQTAALGIFLFGLSLPSGPPLGHMFIQKFDTIAVALLLPVFYTVTGLRVNVHKLRAESSPLLAFVIFMGFVGKIFGVLMASMVFRLPFSYALSLALILSSKGVMEVVTYNNLKDSRILTEELYSLAILSWIVANLIILPTVKWLYDPSKRYKSNKLHSILNSDQKGIFRMTVCVHNEDNVPSMVKILEASSPTRESPIWVSILQLTELVGHRKAILMPHFKNCSKPGLTRTYSERIVNSFNILEKYHGHNHVQVQHFTVVAPYATMHNDICTVAHDKGSSIIVMPFHKLWTVDGTVDDSFASIRKVNRHVLKKAPCSVGILVDRGQMRGSNINSVLQDHQTLYSIALLFLGGVDDCEALVYARRMAQHPSVKLLVIWIKAVNDTSKSEQEEAFEKEMMEEFLASAEGKENIRHDERMVEDGTGTTSIARSLEEHIDLVMVGRHHHYDSPALSGLADWSDCPELGAMGDMLATWDFQFSVLIVQQQVSNRGGDGSKGGSKYSRVSSIESRPGDDRDAKNNDLYAYSKPS